MQPACVLATPCALPWKTVRAMRLSPGSGGLRKVTSLRVLTAMRSSLNAIPLTASSDGAIAKWASQFCPSQAHALNPAVVRAEPIARPPGLPTAQEMSKFGNLIASILRKTFLDGSSFRPVDCRALPHPKARADIRARVR